MKTFAIAESILRQEILESPILTSAPRALDKLLTEATNKTAIHANELTM